MGLHEGVCNHLSFMVPGRDDLFLVNPDGWSFSEITASRLLICDFHRNVIAGDGVPEDTAFYIHARLHARLPRARAAFHTHMPNATALTMVEGEPLIWAGQTALKFYGRTVVDDAYNGLALDESEGDRIAASVGDADIVFMKHHGVLVLAPSIAKAWDDLYYLERACEVQRLAQSTGRTVVPVPRAIAEATAEQMRHEGGREFATTAFGQYQAATRSRRAGVSSVTRLVPVVLALLSFTGCTLIDQRTFAPSPEAKAEPAPPPAPVALDKRTPLVTIDYTVPSPNYAELLHYAVQAAEARDADVQYDVVVGRQGYLGGSPPARNAPSA